jgi:hypothetical protein
MFRATDSPILRSTFDCLVQCTYTAAEVREMTRSQKPKTWPAVLRAVSSEMAVLSDLLQHVVCVYGVTILIDLSGN